VAPVVVFSLDMLRTHPGMWQFIRTWHSGAAAG